MDNQVIISFLITLVSKYPITATIIGVMGTARLILKPVMTCLHAIAESTETTKDNEFLKKLEEHKVFKAISFILDYAFSIKVPVTKK